MPELPEALRRALPREAQRLYRETYREARDGGADEDSARVAAQEAVEDAFHRVGGKWVRDEAGLEPAGPYGETAIAVLARGARFPCTTGQFVRETGDPTIEIAPDEPMKLADLLALVDGYYWQDAAQLLQAVHQAWPQVKRQRDGARLAPAP